MNYGKYMEWGGTAIIVISFIYAIYQDATSDASFSDNFGFDSLPFLIGLLLWSLGYMMNTQRNKKKG